MHLVALKPLPSSKNGSTRSYRYIPRTGNRAWPASLYLLSSPILESRDIAGYIDAGCQSIDIPRLVDDSRSWSEAERIFVQVTRSLWCPGYGAPLFNLLNRLDDENFGIVMRAIRMYREA